MMKKNSKTSNESRRKTRLELSQRLRRYFEDLKAQMESDSEDFLRRVLAQSQKSTRV
jgi:hypothetical protein